MSRIGAGVYNWQDLTIYNTYSLWLWGTDFAPGQTRMVAIRSGSHDSISGDYIEINQASYFANGPGRNFTLAHSNAVQFFFADRKANGAGGLIGQLISTYYPAGSTRPLKNGEYYFSANEIITAGGFDIHPSLVGANILPAYLYQYQAPNQGETREQYLVRTFAVGSDQYLVSNAEFRVNATNGAKAIVGAQVTKDKDNYDFDSQGGVGGGFSLFGIPSNVQQMGLMLDPQGIARSYEWKFVGPLGATQTISRYSETDFLADLRKPWVDSIHDLDGNSTQSNFIDHRELMRQAAILLWGTGNWNDLKSLFRAANIFGGGEDIQYGTINGETLLASAEKSTLVGGPGNDHLVGNGARNTLLGGSDNDILNGGFGRDTLDGGPGADTYDVTAGDIVILDSADGGLTATFADGRSSWLTDGSFAFTQGGLRYYSGTGANRRIYFVLDAATNRLFVDLEGSGDNGDGHWVEIRGFQRRAGSVRTNGIWLDDRDGTLRPPLEGYQDGSGRPIRHCFLAGTPILMASGKRKAIEKIEVGDLVFAFDPNEQGGRGELREKRVTQVFSKETDDVVLLNGSLRVTRGHVFFTAAGEFRELRDLAVGDTLVAEFGAEIPIKSIAPINGSHRVYNFAVEDLHTYVAGGYRVHNESIEKFNEVLVNGVAVEITLVHQQDDGTIHIWTRDGEDISSELRLPTGQVIRRSGHFGKLPAEIQALFGNGGVFVEAALGDEAKKILRTDAFEDVTLDPVTADGISRLQNANEVGRAFGARLGAIINLDDPFADIVLDAVLVVAAGNLAEIIEARGVSVQLPMGSVNVLEGLPLELINEILDSGQAQISSYLSKRLIVAIGVQGFAGELLEGLSQSLINDLLDVGQQILNNLLDNNPGTTAYSGVSLETLKANLRAQAETLLTARLQSMLSTGLNLDAPAAAFIASLINPMIEAGVDLALDIARNDGDDELAALTSALSPTAIRERFLGAAKAYVSTALSTAVVEGLGLDGQSIGAQFGRELATQIIDNVVGAAFDPGTFLFDQNGINFDTVLAGVGDITSRFAISSLVAEVGLRGPAGEFATALGNQVVSNIAQGGLQNAFSGFNLTSIATSLARAVGVSVWADVMDSLIKNEAGAIGAQIGSLIGSIWGPIGAKIGEIIGAIVGNWFGKTPEAGAQLWYNAGTQEFVVSYSWRQGKGKRSTAEGIANQVADTLNGVLGAVGGVLLNASEITPGHYGMRKDYLTYRERDRSDTRARFDKLGDLVGFGVFNALEEVKIAGGNVYVKRALYRGLELQRDATIAKVYGSEESAFGVTGNEVDVLLGDLAVGADYARYVQETATVNALVGAESNSFFAAGWAITLQRASELGLMKRHGADWFGGWTFFMDERADGKVDGRGWTPANLSLELDPDTRERLIWIRDSAGAWLSVMRDTIDTGSKDHIVATAGADTVTVNVDTIAFTTALTLNGAAATAGNHQIRIAAMIDGGAGADTIRGGDLGNDLLGGLGDDVLVGGKLDDWLFGGDGNDRMFAGAATITFTIGDAAGEGAAIAIDGGNGDFLDGGAADDVLYGGKGSDWLTGGAGADRILGGAGGDILDGGAGNDRGATGEAIVLGGAGSDQYAFYYGAGVDVIFDESDPLGAVGGVDSFTARMARFVQGIEARNWAGRGQYLENGDIKGGEDAIVFGPGITLNNVLMRRSGSEAAPGNDLIIQLQAEVNGVMILTGDELTIKDWFNVTRRVEWLRFADGEEVRIGNISSFYIGTGGPDVIIGSFGSDFMVGGEGNDRLYGLAGGDFGFGGAGDDLVAGDSDNDMVAGGSGADEVIGGTGNDTVFGDAGNDELYGGAGSDILAGGLGDDTIVTGADDQNSLTNDVDAIRFARGDGRDIVLDEFVNNWDVVMQNGAYLNGYALQANGTVTLGALIVFDGTKWIGQYDWNDTTGVLRRHKGAVAGQWATNAGVDTLEFGIGIDIQDLVLRRVSNDLEMAVGAGDLDARSFDQITDRVVIKDWYLAAAAKSIERFFFTEIGVLTMAGYTLAGGTDIADTLAGTTTADWITGGAGDDTITANSGDDILSGGQGLDVLKGQAGLDVLYGGGGDDLLEGGAGADQLFGGEGLDIASYATSAAVVISLATGTTSGGDAAGDAFLSIEGLEGGAGADTLTGDGDANILRGLAGADTLSGGAGDDIYEFDVSHGGDVINDIAGGDGGSDAILFGTGLSLSELAITRTSAGANLRIGTGGTNTIDIQGQNAVERRIETIVFSDGLTGDLSALKLVGEAGTSGADLMFGDTNANTILGGAGNDIIAGRSGNDNLQGGDGDDTLEGGLGADTLNGGADAQTSGGAFTSGADDYGDTIRYVTSSAAVVIDVAARTTSGGHAASDVIVVGAAGFASIEHVVGSDGFGDTLRGDARVNRLVGLGGDDILDGRAGDDVLSGGDGNDTLTGGDGADSVAGDAGIDTVSAGLANDLVSGGDGADILNGNEGDDSLMGGAGADTIHGDADNDQVSGDGDNDQIYGDSGDDQLAGGAGSDTLLGGDGADTLSGDAGADSLRGEIGDDVYLFSSNSGADTIIDAAGVNKIVLSDISSSALWFTRSGNDLKISTIGVPDSAFSIVVSGYYLAPTAMREIAAADASLYLKYADPLVTAMTASGAAAPATMPGAISAMLSTYWHVGGKAKPTAADASASTDEDIMVQGSVGAVDHDENIASYALETPPAYGSASVNELGAWTYTPLLNYFGPDAFAIRVTDAHGQSAVKQISVVVASANDAPHDIALGGALRVVERDRPATGAATDAIPIGTLSAADVDIPDAGDFGDIAFSVSDARFEVVNGNELRLKAGAALDFEAGAVVNVSVTATDRNGAGLAFTKTVAVGVLDADDYLYGSDAGEILVGQAGRNIIFGHGGGDTITGAGAADTVDGGDGADSIYGLGGDDSLTGGLGNDLLDGGAGVDVLDGGAGDDVVLAGDGDDQLVGGAGVDVLGGGIGADTLLGGDQNDTLTGAAGADRLEGGTGDDVLNGGADADRFLGGAGLDTITYADALSSVSVNLATGSGAAGAAAGDIFEDAVERLVGSGFADTITGSAGDDVIEGGSGDDNILGGLGNDELLGGDGNDTIDAQAGNDKLNGGAGVDTLIGGDDSDTYVMDVNSGVDTIINFDPNGTDIDVLGYNGIDRTRLWFERSSANVNDLVITAIETGVVTTIKNWYLATPADRANFKIDFLLTGLATANSINAEGLVTLMAGYAKPATMAQYNALHANTAFETQWLAHWTPNAPPVVPDILAQTINEDGVLTLTVRITDDVTPLAGIGVTATPVQVGNETIEDWTIVESATFAAPNASGDRILTVTTKPNQSGLVKIKVRASDAGNLVTEKVFVLNVTPITDAPANPVASVAAPIAPLTKPTLDGGSWAVAISAPLNDQDGSEVLNEVRVSGLPPGITFNKGTDLGAGVWSFTPAQLTGLAIVGPATWSQDLALSVTANARETATGAIGPWSAPTALNVVINARPTDITGVLSINENAANGAVVGSLARADADAGDTATYAFAVVGAVTQNAGARFALSTAGQVTVANGALLNFEAAASHVIRVRVTDSGGLFYEKDLTVAINNVNEAPTALALSNVVASLTETASTAAATRVADISYTDDALGAETLSLAGADAGLFEVVGGSLYLRAGTALNYETRSSYSVTVNVDDASTTPNPDLWQAFTLAITDVNEAPSNVRRDNNTTSFTINENQGVAPGTPATDTSGAVVKLTATDPENAALAYEIVSGTGVGRFSIGPDGTLYKQADIDYEAGTTSFTLGVRAWDGGAIGAGNASAAQTLTIGVANVNEGPAPTTITLVSASTTFGVTDLEYRINVADPEGNALGQVIALTGSPIIGSITPTSFNILVTRVGTLGIVGLPVDLRLVDSLGGSRVTTVDRVGTGSGIVASPVILDLDEDGLEVVSLTESAIRYDMNGDGDREQTGWVGADDGLLVLDRNGDGAISQGGEISFLEDMPGAQSDMEGLRAFDSNSDAVFDAQDARFGEFMVWRDANQDGVSQGDELSSLAALGIAAINLAITPNPQATSEPYQNRITGFAEFVRTDGAIGLVGDAVFAYVETAISVEEVPDASAPATSNANDAAGERVDRRANSPPANERRGGDGGGGGASGAVARSDSDNEAQEFELRDHRRRGGRGERSEPARRRPEPLPAAVSIAVANDVEEPRFVALGAQQSALRTGLGVMDRKLLGMIDAMVQFEASSSADLGLGRKKLDPRVGELLTSLPDLR